MPDIEDEYPYPYLGGGGYGAIEADLGEKLRPLAGFGRDLDDPFVDWELEGAEILTPGAHSTLKAAGIRYVSPDQLETWDAKNGWSTGG